MGGALEERLYLLDYMEKLLFANEQNFTVTFFKNHAVFYIV